MEMKLIPVGDGAVSVIFGSTIDPITNRQVHALARRLHTQPPEGFLAAVPGYTTLLVQYYSLCLSSQALPDWIERENQAASQVELPSPRLVEIPVRYGGSAGPDLDQVAALHQMTTDEVIHRHAAPIYTVYLIGFLPGFAYLGGMDPLLATPRLSSPRQSIPAGSVGIAGAQTGIYPLASPGGWQLIGRTNLTLFDPARTPPTLLTPGDEVRFIHVPD